MKQSKGFTLIELIVVIAIIAIFATIGTLVYSSITSKKTVASADTVEITLKEAKTLSIASSVGSIITYVGKDNSGNAYISIEKNGVEYKRKILDNAIKLSYADTESSSFVTIANGTNIKFIYNKSTGAFNSSGYHYALKFTSRKEITLYFNSATGNIYR